jgi:hypothetical protein
MGWIGSQFGARWCVASGGFVVLLAGVAAVTVVARRNELTLRQSLRLAFRREAAA